MNVLGIETSCDETALAVLVFDDAGHSQILSEEISSQSDIHSQYGGVVPELASREHLRNLPLLYEAVLTQAGVALSDISLLGVTQGPGLKGCLLMGMGFAKGLSLAHKIPLYAVNHIEGHLLAPLLDNPELQFPYLALVVSGGHTEILLVDDVARYQLLARTIDDAAGEAFDKSANLLGIDYPGGATLAALADTVSDSPFELPKVMRKAAGFSFSGLKTAISLLIQKHSTAIAENELVRAQLAYSIQESIVDALCFKLEKAIQQTGVCRVVVTGGVSANRRLREQAQECGASEVYFPKPQHCMDNAAMIAFTAWQHAKRDTEDGLCFEARARWPVEEVTTVSSKNAPG